MTVKLVAVLSEAIVNQHPDFPVAVVKFWFQEMLRHKRLQDPSLTADARIASVPFLDVVAGTEDLWKGYRQSHPIAEHMSVNIITFCSSGNSQTCVCAVVRLAIRVGLVGQSV